MPFLNPFLLGGLVFAAVPVLLMLLMNRKRIVLPWAAYNWVREVVVRQKKKWQIDDLLKLFSKILLIIAIVLMITRPFIRLEGVRGKTLLVLDNSPSMGLRIDNETQLDKAKEHMARFVQDNRNDMALYSFDGKFDPVVSVFTDDKQALTEGLKQVELGTTFSGASTWFQELPKLPVMGDTERIYFVGDFQAHWYADGARISEAMKVLGKGYPLTWHQVEGPHDVDNCAITRLALTSDGAFLGRNSMVEVSILNGTAEQTDARTVSLYVDGEQKVRTTIKLEPNELREIPFTVSLGEAGRHNVMAEITADPYERDDVRYLVVDVPDVLNVLAVVPRHDRAPFAFDTYIRGALEGLIEDEDALQYSSIEPSELLRADFSKVDVVLTVNMPLSGDMPYVARLRTFVEQGGGLVAFLPAESPDDAGMFDVVGRVVETREHVDGNVLQNSYLAFMTAPELKPEKIIFTRSLIFDDVPEEEIRLRTVVGVNAFSREMGEGRVVVLGFVPYQNFGNLHFNPNYVQMCLRLFWEARGHRAEYAVSGEFESWSEPGLARDAAYVLRDDKGGQWALSVDGLGEDTSLVLPPDLKLGFYSVSANGEEMFRVGFSIDAGDSIVEPVTEGALKDPIEEGLSFVTGDSPLNGLSRIDLFPLVLLLLLGAIAFEAYAHFFRDDEIDRGKIGT